MVKDPQFFFTDLMEKPKISIGPQPDQGADFVADVFHCVVLCYDDFYRLWVC